MDNRIMIRKYRQEDIYSMTEIWNEVVEEGVAFPQEDCLTVETGEAFFAQQSTCGVAEDTETGLAFTATAPDLSEATGVITLEGDIATVTFDPGWNGFEGVYSYKYYKTSDTPNFNL